MGCKWIVWPSSLGKRGAGIEHVADGVHGRSQDLHVDAQAICPTSPDEKRLPDPDSQQWNPAICVRANGQSAAWQPWHGVPDRKIGEFDGASCLPGILVIAQSKFNPEVDLHPGGNSHTQDIRVPLREPRHLNAQDGARWIDHILAKLCEVQA